jgi:hypothetical protein
LWLGRPAQRSEIDILCRVPTFRAGLVSQTGWRRDTECGHAIELLRREERSFESHDSFVDRVAGRLLLGVTQVWTS